MHRMNFVCFSNVVILAFVCVSLCHLKYVYRDVYTLGIACLNIYGAHVTGNNSTTNNIVLFFVSASKIVYY